MLFPFAWFVLCFYGFYRLIFYLLASGLVKPGGINIVPFVVIFWLLGFGLFAFGFSKGPPRWFMPYIGLLLPIFNLFVYERLIIPSWGGIPHLSYPYRFLVEFIDQGLIWVGLFTSIILLVIVIKLVPGFRLFYQRLRNDWTLLSFIAYGIVPFAIIYSYGDYEMDFANQGPYLFLIVMIFAAGGWFYLRANTPLKSVLPLIVAMAMSMFVAELSRTILYEFPRNLQLTWQAKLLQISWQTKLMEITIIWIWVALFLISPFLVKWLPGRGDTSHVLLKKDEAK